MKRTVYYRIADITLCSEITLPSFAAFACEPSEPDVTLCRTSDTAPAGKEIVSGSIVHRCLPDGWFCHSPHSDAEGLFISGDYTELRYCGDQGAYGAIMAERYVRLALECLLVRRGYVSIHAAAVELDGAAYAFTGPSGIGKSTRASVWTETFGARLINGDRPLVCVDTLELFGMPWDGKEQCFRNVRMPLRAILEVRRAEFVRVRRLSTAQRRRLLVCQCFMPMWDTETAVIQMRNLIRLSQKADILRAFSGKTPEEAGLLRGMIDQKCCQGEETDMKAKQGFILRKVAGEYVLMPTDTNIGVYNGAVLLNSVSAFVWEQMQKEVTRDELLAAVMDEFEVDEETAGKDLDMLLEKLAGMDLIEKI